MPTAFTILPQVLGRRYIHNSSSNSGRKGSELDQNDLREICIAVRYCLELEDLVFIVFLLPFTLGLEDKSQY